MISGKYIQLNMMYLPIADSGKFICSFLGYTYVELEECKIRVDLYDYIYKDFFGILLAVSLVFH